MYYGNGKEFRAREQLKPAIEEYIDYYNRKRIQKKVGYLSPLIFQREDSLPLFRSSFEGSPHDQIHNTVIHSFSREHTGGSHRKRNRSQDPPPC